MTFEYPYLLLLIALALPLFAIWRRSVREREEKLKRYAESGFREKLFTGDSPKLRKWHFLFLFSALVCMLAAVSGPQLAGKKEKVRNTGIDIMVVIDVSNSMRAEDLLPNRLERAKLALLDMLPRMGEDRIGVVVFAGTAYTNLPLTSDHPAAEMLINSISPDMISMQGTAIADAIDQATVSFSKEDKERGKAIILISDGENFEGDAVEATNKAAEKGIIVSCIGVGSSNGEKIPLYDNEGNSLGNKKDEYGNEVVTKLNETLLKDIASKGSGIYVHASPGEMGLTKIYSMLQGLAKTTKETWRYSSYTPLYQWFVLLAGLLLLIELFLREGKRKVNDDKRSIT